MATGSVSDIVARLQKWLPQRWFPIQAKNADGTVPRIFAQLVSWSTALSQVFAQIQYAKAQTRVGTATDGWLDLASQDYYGGNLPRLAGETDPAFAARIIAAFPPRGATRPQIIAALTAFTGTAPRVVEPWRLQDTGAWDAGISYWDIDTQQNPWRWGDASVRYQGFIITPAPPTPAGPNPVRTWDDSAYWDEANAYGFYWLDLANSVGQAQLEALITRTHVEGTIVWLQIGSPSTT